VISQEGARTTLITSSTSVATSMPETLIGIACVLSAAPHSLKDVNDMLLRILGDFNLTQTVREPTRHSSILDLFITSYPGLHKSTHVIPGDSDHEVVISDNYIMPVRTKKKSRKIFLYSKANWDDIKTAMTRFAIDSICVQYHS